MIAILAMIGPYAFWILCATFACLQMDAPAKSEPTQSAIGVSKVLAGVVLPGPELEVTPFRDQKAPVIVAITEVYRHGGDFRYDIRYEGLEAGRHDLRKYLRRKDGKPVGPLPELPIVVEARLTGDAKLLAPHALESSPMPVAGGYRTIIACAAAVWLLGLVLILKRRAPPANATEAIGPAAPRTLADRLRPLVERALAGQSSAVEQASLERSLLAFWRKRLRLETADPAAALMTLRGHDEAGALLNHLDRWLHMPASERPAKVDLQQLLEPYRTSSADELELATSGLPR